MMNSEIKDGIWPVMVTPFDEGMNVVYDTVDHIVDFYYNNGCAGVFATCLTSEVADLSYDEILELVKATVKSASGRLQVVGGAILFENVERQIELVKHVYDCGAHAVVVAASQLCGKNDSVDTFKANITKLMDETGDIPLGMYECPFPYHRILSPETYLWLAKTGRFVFHKDTCCNIDGIKEKLTLSAGTKMKFFNAHCATLLDSLACGGNGYCGVGTNYYPEIFSWLFENYNSADPALVKKVYDFAKDSESYYDLCDAYPATAKELLKNRGIDIEDYCRIKTGKLDKIACEQLQQLAEKIVHIRESFNTYCCAV
ncbi:MAG: dihydrodipicolinate synthase family protein [Sedimentisphaeraceae bacterium JB056]